MAAAPWALWTTSGKIRHVDTMTGMLRDAVPLPTDEGLVIDVSPDGRLGALLSGGEEDGFQIWDGMTGKELHKLPGHPGGTTAVGFSPDSQLVVSSGADNTIRIWRAVTGKEILHINNLNGMGVAFSPDGKLLVVLCEDDLCLFETSTGKERCRLKAPNVSPSCICFSPDSKLLAVNAGDEVIRMWDIVQAKLLRGLVGHQGAVQTMVFASRGDMLASGSSDGTVRLWKVADGEELRCFEGHQGAVRHVAFSEDGKLVISSGSDNCIIVWDVASRAVVKSADPAIKKMDQRWADLAHEDGMTSFKAIGEMIGLPKETVKFLETKLRPVPALDPGAIQRLVDNLDSKNFNARQKATRELEKLEGQARAAMEKAFAKPPSAEVKERLKKLLDRLEAPLSAPEDLRAVRAIEVLERIGTPEARDLLGRLAKGAAGARQTREAGESLARLNR